MRFPFGLLTTLALTLVASGCIPSIVDESGHTPYRQNTEWRPLCRRPQPSIVNDRIDPDCIEEPLNIWQLIDIALRNNPQTQQSWHLARASAYNVGIAKSTLYPTLIGTEELDSTQSFGAGSGGGTFSGGTSSTFGGGGGAGPGHFDSINSSLSLSYLLVDFGGRCANIESAYEALYAANWTHNRVVQTMIINTLSSYYNYEYFLGLVDAKKMDLIDAQENLQAANEQYQMGVSTIVDVLQAQANEVNARLQLVSAEGQLGIAMAALATAIGWPADAHFAVIGLPEKLPLVDITDDMCHLFDIAKDSRPDLAAALSLYLESKANIGVQISAALPTLSLFGVASGTKYFGDHSRLNGQTQRAALNLTAPIFSGWFHENEIASARELAAANFAAWKNTELAVMLDVVTAYFGYNTAVQTLAFAEEYLKYSQKAFDAALTGYRQGTGSILAVLTAETTLSDARAQLIQAKTSLLVAIAQLAYATGTM